MPYLYINLSQSMKKGSSTYAGADTGLFDFSVFVLLEGSKMEEYTSLYVNCAK